MPTSCVLRTRRPSPTTVSFTVSTRSPQRAPARILHHALLLLRFLAACEILLLLWYKYATSVGSIPPWISSSVPGATAQSFARSLPGRYLVPGALVCLWILTKRGYTGMSDLCAFVKTKPGQKSHCWFYAVWAFKRRVRPTRTCRRPQRASFLRRLFRTSSSTKHLKGSRCDSTWLSS
jgi:hypothetical protein